MSIMGNVIGSCRKSGRSKHKQRPAKGPSGIRYMDFQFIGSVYIQNARPQKGCHKVWGEWHNLWKGSQN